MTAAAQKWIDRTRNVLAFFLIGAFVGSLLTLVHNPIPGENKDLMTYMLGQLSGMATMALGYYFSKVAGQDVLDAARTENTGRALEAIKATASVAAVPVDVKEAAAQVAEAAADEADAIKGKAP